MSSATVWQFGSFRLAMTTSAPASAQPRAMAAPIPRLPPVTTATLPVKSSRFGPPTSTRAPRPAPGAVHDVEGRQPLVEEVQGLVHKGGEVAAATALDPGAERRL